MAVTIVMPYYENPNMLNAHLREWRAYKTPEKTQLRVVIVDDGSPRNPAVNVIVDASNSLPFPIAVYRIVPNIPWNQDGARNLAMKHVETEWVLMTDMDHMLTWDDAAAFLRFMETVRRGFYYMPHRVDFDGKANHPHANSYVFNVTDFWNMGGYDEDFAGCYGSDGNFRKCARGYGLIEKVTAAFELTRWGSNVIDDANTKDWGRKDSPYHRSQFPHIEAKSRGPAYVAQNPIRFDWQRVF